MVKTGKEHGNGVNDNEANNIAIDILNAVIVCSIAKYHCLLL